jgi:hypothetical protein
VAEDGVVATGEDRGVSERDRGAVDVPDGIHALVTAGDEVGAAADRAAGDAEGQQLRASDVPVLPVGKFGDVSRFPGTFDHMA